MEEEHNVPDAGEVVVCKVRQVLGYGAFVELVEYDNAKGFVHISQIATRWVKNIRTHVKEGQIRAAKVLSLNRDRGQIDLSLTKVSSHAQRARIEEWKQLKRCKKLLEVVAKGMGKNFDDAWENVAKPLLENHYSISEAFQEIALSGESAAAGVDPAWLKPLVEMVEKNVPIPKKTVKGILSLRSFEPNGVDIIKKALKPVDESKEEVDVFYSGGGKYALTAHGPDFKTAERVLNQAAEAVEKAMKASGGEAEFKRSE